MLIRVIGSGSKGNSTIIKVDKKMILIDIGFSYKSFIERLRLCEIAPEDISAIFITHEHGDHIRGLGKFVMRHRVSVYMSEGTYNNISARLKNEIGNNISLFRAGETIDIENLMVKSFTVSHDASDPVGYTFQYADKKIGLATDIGYTTGDVVENLTGSNVLVLESNHDLEMLRKGPYPIVLKHRISGPSGHLSNDGASKLLSKVCSPDLTTVFLAHISEENNDPEIALQTAVKHLPKEGNSLPRIKLTYQDKPTDWHQV